MTNQMIAERDSQLFSLAYTIDNCIDHELDEMESELSAAIHFPGFEKVEQKYLEDDVYSSSAFMTYLSNLNQRKNEECILLETPDGRMKILGDHPEDTFTFLPDSCKDAYQVCYDSYGTYYLTILVEGNYPGVRFHIVLDLDHFYANIVPAELLEDYWIVIGDEDSGLMVQNHDNQASYVVLTAEELANRNDGYMMIMQNQISRQKTAQTYLYANYHNQITEQRLVTLPSNQTVNGSFVIGIAQDSQELYRTIHLYQFMQTCAIFCLFLCGLYALWDANLFLVQQRLNAERFERLNMEKKLTEKIAEAKLQNLISQLQPHFMYNSLSSIRELIFDDPGLAADKLYDFTKYLRASIKALRTREVIPFEEELQNIQSYTSIEKMRIGESLEIVYDIEDSDFSVPAFSIQMLVENAIRHGIAKKRGKKGKVTIRSRRRDDAIWLMVKDDGMGFDYEKTMREIDQGTRDSTGLSNTIWRLDKSLHATVSVETAVGCGTEIIIRIPLAADTTTKSIADTPVETTADTK